MRLPLLLILAACSDPARDSADPGALPARDGLERAPLTAACDDQDDARCILPFPNNRFARLDPSSVETGLRLQIDPASLEGPPDEPDFLNTHDGFSRIGSVMTAWDADIDPSWLGGLGQPIALDAPIRLFNAQPDHPDYGQQVPLWAEIIQDPTGMSLVMAHPLQPMADNADHVVVITDELVDLAGEPLPRSDDTAVLLGLTPATDAAQEELVWYHGPTRALLAEVGIAREQVLRTWDFTTRSQDDVSRRLLTMLAGVQAANDDLDVIIDRVQGSGNPDVAMVVEGRVTGVPLYLDAEDRFVFDADKLPTITGENEAAFRILVPAGGYDSPDGPYKISLYAHGTGGDFHDDSMDGTFAANGVAKLGLQLGAWNGTELFDTFARVMAMNRGVEQSTGQLLQSLVDAHAVYQALDGPLGEALMAAEIGGQPNPAAGRSFDAETPLWTAGSLGGTLGAVVGASFPEVRFAAINVPGGAWTHFIPQSYLYDWIMKGVMEGNFGGPVNARIAIALSQGGWDDVDGGAWSDVIAEKGVVFLMQESVNDSVMPNVGTELLARALGAQHVGVPLTAMPGVGAVDELTGATGVTQYWVDDTGPYDVHGFAAKDSPAGDAALEQIFGFARSAWSGSARITVPTGCEAVQADGRCDFRSAR